jgi:predicted nucleic acid-binding protein
MEGNNLYQPILASFFDLHDNEGFLLITSSITLLEVLVKPLREGQTAIAKQYRDILTNAPGMEIIEVTSAIAEHAARLRAKYNVSTPDAIHLATCIKAGADYFLTNDNRLKIVSEVDVVTVMELTE